ncbi:MAG: FecR domain-containing protein [Tannerellaceae bacterium]
MNNIDQCIRSFLGGKLNATGHARLRQWIAKSEDNRKRFSDYFILWKVLAVESNECGFDANKAYNRFYAGCKTVKNNSYYRTLFRISSAAVLFLSVGIISLYFTMKHAEVHVSEVQRFVVEVPAGARSRVVFPDNSVVWLNSESRIEYNSNFAKESRNVRLYGEGYFEVAKNKEMPFVVNAGKLSVEVLGTKFNLKSYEEDAIAQVTLKEGSVKIGQLTNNIAPITLKPNQQYTYSESENLTSVESVDASHIESWRDGSVLFDKMPLSEIAKQLKRMYDIPVNIESDKLNDLVYYSDFNINTPITKVLEILSSGNKFSYEVKSDCIRIFN